jgi:hypothetical protein
MVREAVARVGLDLKGCRVLTEAATGAYVVTPVIAAVAGAEVTALTKTTRHGTADMVREQTSALADQLGVAQRIQVVESLSAHDIGLADIVTNSGHLRPLDADFIGQMKRGAAIPLMYESWELRPGEVDIEACRRQGVLVAGTNECHPNVRVFDYLGMLALQGLLQCRIPVTFSRILLICDNPFLPHIAKPLIDCQAELEILGRDSGSQAVSARCLASPCGGAYDAVVVAATPESRPILGRQASAKYDAKQIGRFRALVQVWGDVDRACLQDVVCWPPTPPAVGHMGVQLSDLGPEPVVRLQAAGLRVGQDLFQRQAVPRGPMEYCQPLEDIPNP